MHSTHFAFLDQHRFVVAAGNGCELRVYTVDSAKPLSATPPSDTFPENLCVRVFLLPPAKEGRFVQIRQLASQQVPPGRPGCAPAFEHDTQLAILAISFYTGSEPPSVLPRRRRDEEHTLVVPISALLAHTSPCCSCEQQSSRVHEHRSDVPWETWGAPRSRLFQLVDGGWKMTVYTSGSRCIFRRFRPREGCHIVTDILVVDFGPWANYGAAEDREDPLPEYLDTSDVIATHENLAGPIHNRLPFRASRTLLAFGEDIDHEWGRVILTPLPDGFLAAVSLCARGSSGLYELA